MEKSREKKKCECPQNSMFHEPNGCDGVATHRVRRGAQLIDVCGECTLGTDIEVCKLDSDGNFIMRDVG